MSEMNISQLNVDLIQDSASVSMYKSPAEHVPGKNGVTSVNVSVPIHTPGNRPENELKKIAVEAAKSALHEALRALDRHPI